MFSDYVAGISVSEDLSHLALLEIKKHDIRVRYVGESTRTSRESLWYLDPLFAPANRILRKTSRVAVALDNADIFFHSCPMDATLSQTERNEQIEWELSNYIPNFRGKDYVRDVYTLRTHGYEQVHDIFIIAAKRASVFSIQDALAAHKLELHVADAHHYGAQYALLVNYPEIASKLVLLVSVSAQRLDLGFLNNGRLIFYRYVPASTPEQALEGLQSHLHLFPATDLFFCGVGVSDRLLAMTRQRFKLNVLLLNPFRHLTVGLSHAELLAVKGTEHRFAAAIGCALRKQ